MQTKDQFGRLRVAAAVGVTQDVVDRVTALNESGVDAVIIDTAHGHTKGVVAALQRVKAKFPNLDVVVGNIATPEAALYLMEAGADACESRYWTRFYLYNPYCSGCWFSTIECRNGSSKGNRQ
jgi:pyridoxal biosynthesis lyase PdxS